MTMIWSGFVVGFLGSLHCVAMCGPLALAIPIGEKSRLLSAVLYNLGRTFTYVLIGAAFGLLGRGINLWGFQSVLSIISGSFIVIATLYPALSKVFSGTGDTRLSKLVRKSMGHRIRKGGYLSITIFGLFNGLLPCGLIYVAVAAALETGYVESAMAYMGLFGLGTSMLMVTTMFSKSFLNKIKVINTKKVIPYFAVALGLLLILRGIMFQVPASYDDNELIHFMKTITFCNVK